MGNEPDTAHSAAEVDQLYEQLKVLNSKFETAGAEFTKYMKDKGEDHADTKAAKEAMKAVRAEIDKVSVAQKEAASALQKKAKELKKQLKNLDKTYSTNPSTEESYLSKLLKKIGDEVKPKPTKDDKKSKPTKKASGNVNSGEAAAAPTFSNGMVDCQVKKYMMSSSGVPAAVADGVKKKLEEVLGKDKVIEGDLATCPDDTCVVVVGDNAYLNKCITTLMETRQTLPPMAVVPTATHSSFARNLAITDVNGTETVNCISNKKARTVDIAKIITKPVGKEKEVVEYFVGELVYPTPPGKLSVVESMFDLGRLMIGAFRQHTVVLDGCELTPEEKPTILNVQIGPLNHKGASLVPNAVMDDGKLNVVGYTEEYMKNKLGMLKKFGDKDTGKDGVWWAEFKSMVITPDKASARCDCGPAAAGVTVDKKAALDKTWDSITVEVVPGALTVFAPAPEEAQK